MIEALFDFFVLIGVIAGGGIALGYVAYGFYYLCEGSRQKKKK